MVVLSRTTLSFNGDLIRMLNLEQLLNHSNDEEYIGAHSEPAGADVSVIEVEFKMFSRRLKELEGTIDASCSGKSLDIARAGEVPHD